jgi:hypothetical protein
MKTDKPRPRGRPTVAADKAKSARYPLRLTVAQRDKLELLGGADWIRARIDGARLPKS